MWDPDEPGWKDWKDWAPVYGFAFGVVAVVGIVIFKLL